MFQLVNCWAQWKGIKVTCPLNRIVTKSLVFVAIWCCKCLFTCKVTVEIRLYVYWRNYTPNQSKFSIPHFVFNKYTSELFLIKEIAIVVISAPKISFNSRIKDFPLLFIRCSWGGWRQRVWVNTVRHTTRSWWRQTGGQIQISALNLRVHHMQILELCLNEFINSGFTVSFILNYKAEFTYNFSRDRETGLSICFRRRAVSFKKNLCSHQNLIFSILTTL